MVYLNLRKVLLLKKEKAKKQLVENLLAKQLK